MIKITFSDAINTTTAASSVTLVDNNSNLVPLTLNYANNDSAVVVNSSSPLSYISKYTLNVSTSLKSTDGGSLLSAVTLNITTAIDSTDKFPVISDDSLLTLVQKQTFGYFWDFGHPVSGMARERNTSGDEVATGGNRLFHYGHSCCY